MSASDLIGPVPELAEDGLCVNTECSKRWWYECPVFRLLESLAMPEEITNIIEFPNSDRETVWFSKKTHTRYLPKNVVSFEESTQWLELKSQEIQDEKSGISRLITNALNVKKQKKPSAEIIAFPKEKIA
jgi:hypothetical protein